MTGRLRESEMENKDAVEVKVGYLSGFFVDF
jgi:hypothetical protein